MNDFIVSINNEKAFGPYKAAMGSRLLEYSDDLEHQVLECYRQCKRDAIGTVIHYTHQFDSQNFQGEHIYLPAGEVDQWVECLSDDERAAIAQCEANIAAYNQRLLAVHKPWQVEIAPGHRVGQKTTAVDTALLWVPAKKAPLVAVAPMLVVPARIAGVKHIILATPPGPDGLPDRLTMAAGRLCGATHFLVGNGVSLLAAAAVGGLAVPRPDVMYGPGPSAIGLTMIHAMKYGVRSQPGVGPSDALILAPAADYTPDEIEVLARDLLTELEHGPDSFSYILTLNNGVGEKISTALSALISGELGRKEVLSQNLAHKQAGVIVCNHVDEMVNFVDWFAPEHLMIFDEIEACQVLADRLTHVAEIMMGKHAPFSAGNYCIGIPATLPTNGYARAYGGLDVMAFLKTTSLAALDKTALGTMKDTITLIGAREGLPNHAQAAAVRFK